LVDILDAFDINPERPSHISLVGGGGKTTAMFALAHELKKAGASVLVTTTTNIFYPEPGQCDVVFMEAAPSFSLFENVQPGTVTCLGGGVFGEMKKVKSISPEFLDGLFSEGIFDCMLNEADGAKRKAIKAPAEYEPVIPASATAVIGVIGMDVLGLPVKEENVHRVESFCEITGSVPGQIIDEMVVSRLVNHPQGLFKGAPASAARIVLLNKADTEVLCERGRTLAGCICPQTGISAVVSASMKQGRIHEPLIWFKI